MDANEYRKAKLDLATKLKSAGAIRSLTPFSIDLSIFWGQTVDGPYGDVLDLASRCLLHEYATKSGEPFGGVVQGLMDESPFARIVADLSGKPLIQLTENEIHGRKYMDLIGDFPEKGVPPILVVGVAADMKKELRSVQFLLGSGIVVTKILAVVADDEQYDNELADWSDILPVFRLTEMACIFTNERLTGFVPDFLLQSP